MNVLITGCSGFIGSALLEALVSEGNRVLCAVRIGSESRKDLKGATAVAWDADRGFPHISQLEGLDAIVHLAGENISGSWTDDKMNRIIRSRSQGAATLVQAIEGLSQRPGVVVCASGVGYYGDRGQEELDESSGPGSGFLSNVALETERAAAQAEPLGVRVCMARFGMVLSPTGGALAKMLGPFRSGVGGRLGSGKQYWSWVALQDAIAAIRHIINTPQLQGAVNVVAPGAVTNQEFTDILGKVLGRPTLLAVPAMVLKLAMGRLADEVLLASAKVKSAKLANSGFTFHFLDLHSALAAMLQNNLA